MRFINSAQIEHKNAIKDRKLAIKEASGSNVVVSQRGTKISFGELIDDRGRFTVTVAVTSERGVTKRIILPLS
tara:strand:- start:684 stop:902 length:219 start_codon:yes stop_codon:yes gene_type:complete